MGRKEEKSWKAEILHITLTKSTPFGWRCSSLNVDEVEDDAVWKHWRNTTNHILKISISSFSFNLTLEVNVSYSSYDVTSIGLLLIYIILTILRRKSLLDAHRKYIDTVSRNENVEIINFSIHIVMSFSGIFIKRNVVQMESDINRKWTISNISHLILELLNFVIFTKSCCFTKNLQRICNINTAICTLVS
jgi:hypothetical protein